MGIRVGVDLMGGDSPPQVIFEAVQTLAPSLKDNDSIVVFATHAVFSDLGLSALRASSNLTFVTSEDFVSMEDSPLLAIRRKKNATMAAGIRLLKDKKIDAFLSTGNTGALVGFATLHLSLLPSVERPGLLVMMPTEQGKVAVVDVGANINPKPEHLASYAHLGCLIQKALMGKKKCRVGLLNIGSEEQKGTKEMRDAYQLLQKTFKDHFVGNVEGRDVFRGEIDVLVTDGFTGNVFLKTSEGISSFLAEYLHKHFDIPEIVSHLHHQFNYSEHPGAFLCGLDGVVVKCHGFSDQTALISGIKGAFELVRKKVLEQLKVT